MFFITKTVSPSKFFIDGGTINLNVAINIANVILIDNINNSTGSFGEKYVVTLLQKFLILKNKFFKLALLDFTFNVINNKLIDCKK